MLAAAQLLDYNGLFGLMATVIKEPLGNRAFHRVETFNFTRFKIEDHMGLVNFITVIFSLNNFLNANFVSFTC